MATGARRRCDASAITTRCTASTSRGRAILTRDHPEWLVTDRAGRERQEGVVSLAYPEARRAFVDRWTSLIEPTEFDGLFVCLRSQSRPADTADQFGFNEPARRDFLERYGVDVTRDPFDIQAWRDLLGSYLTALVERPARRAADASASDWRSAARGATCSVRRSATRRCRGATGCATTSSIGSSSIRTRRSVRRCGISCGRCIAARATCRTISMEPECRHWSNQLSTTYAPRDRRQRGGAVRRAAVVRALARGWTRPVRDAWRRRTRPRLVPPRQPRGGPARRLARRKIRRSVRLQPDWV